MLFMSAWLLIHGVIVGDAGVVEGLLLLLSLMLLLPVCSDVQEVCSTTTKTSVNNTHTHTYIYV